MRSRGRLGLLEVVRHWGWIGCVGFGGPPAHIALLRELCVERRRWLDAQEFEDSVAACNLLPGPASTQLAILCAHRVAGPVGAVVGGVAFILPGLALILVLSALFLAGAPPAWIRGAGAGAGASVAAVAVHAGAGLVPPSWRRAASRTRWAAYALAGGLGAIFAGPWLVLLLLACGTAELMWRSAGRRRADRAVLHAWPLLLVGATTAGGLAALAWTALKVGALSYGGGFVIIPLMQADAVEQYRWMTEAQFLGAIALGQVTPGPVVHTVAAVGYAAAGTRGALLAATIAFAPSFAFVLLGIRRFDRLRADARVQAFLDGAGPSAVGAILGVAVPLALALSVPWQYALLAASAVALLALRIGVVWTILAAGSAGALAALLDAPLP